MHNSGLVYSENKVAPAGFCAFDDHGRVVRPEMPIPARFPVGSAVFAGDTTGKGHISRHPPEGQLLMFIDLK